MNAQRTITIMVTNWTVSNTFNIICSWIFHCAVNIHKSIEHTFPWLFQGIPTSLNVVLQGCYAPKAIYKKKKKRRMKKLKSNRAPLLHNFSLRFPFSNNSTQGFGFATLQQASSVTLLGITWHGHCIWSQKLHPKHLHTKKHARTFSFVQSAFIDPIWVNC